MPLTSASVAYPVKTRHTTALSKAARRVTKKTSQRAAQRAENSHVARGTMNQVAQEAVIDYIITAYKNSFINSG